MTTITYAPPCRWCGHDRNPLITDICCDPSCSGEDPHEIPGDPINGNDLDLPTARRVIGRLRELGGNWIAHIVAKEIERGDLGLDIPEERAKEVAGLRALADFLEANPEAENPHRYGGSVYFCDRTDYDTGEVTSSAKQEMIRWRKMAGGTWHKGKSWDDSRFELKGNVGGHGITLSASREAVCERIVVATETKIVKEYPPGAFDGIEQIDVEKEVEIVEWKCPDTLR